VSPATDVCAKPHRQGANHTLASGMSAVLEAILAQRKLINDVEHRSRGGEPREALYRTAFEMVERAALADAQKLVADPATPAAQKKRAQEIVEVVTTSLKQSVRVEQHLLAMAAGWTCKHCSEDVPQGAFVTGVQAGRAAIRVDIVCKACGQRSPTTGAGVKVFDTHFGPLVSSTWNPEVHGFSWDRR